MTIQSLPHRHAASGPAPFAHAVPTRLRPDQPPPEGSADDDAAHLAPQPQTLRQIWPRVFPGL